MPVLTSDQEFTVNLYDFDGCAGYYFDNLYHPSTPAFIQEQTYKQLNNTYFAQNCDKKGKNVTLDFSIRQNLLFDLFNRLNNFDVIGHDGGSVFNFLELFTKDLNAQGIDTILDYFSIFDLVAKNKIGNTFENALQQPITTQDTTKEGLETFYNEYEKYSSEFDKEALTDTSKLILTYAEIQYVCQTYQPLKKINIFDDNPNVYNCLKTVFTDFPNLIPKDVSVTFHHYEPTHADLNKPASETFSIVGTGMADSLLSYSILELIKLTRDIEYFGWNGRPEQYSDLSSALKYFIFSRDKKLIEKQQAADGLQNNNIFGVSKNSSETITPVKTPPSPSL